MAQSSTFEISRLQDQFTLSLSWAQPQESDSLLTLKINNNSLDSFKVSLPDSGNSEIICVLPNQEIISNHTISCGPNIIEQVFIIAPNQAKTFTIALAIYKVLVQPYREKFGSNATYQIYWKVYDGNYIEETVYGRNGRSRTDRKPTFLKSNSISIQL